MITMVVAAVAIGLAAGAVWAGLGPAGPASAAEVRLEPRSSAGASPFMPPVGQDQPDVAPPGEAGGEFGGDTPGLFAENGDTPSCDAPTLSQNLLADAAKARAWAEALGIESEAIPSYVESLTPVVLRSDTAVTNHGYRNGTFAAYPAVLQAGTAVFVNSFGEPKVKCFCGNPLTKGQFIAQARYVGTTWGHFRPTSVTIINRTQVVIKNYTVINVKTGAAVDRPAKPPRHDDDPNQPDGDEPDPNQPDPNQPDPHQPDPNQPDPNQPDPHQPDPHQPDPHQPDPNQPDPNQPDPHQPDPHQPDPHQPDGEGGENQEQNTSPGNPTSPDDNTPEQNTNPEHHTNRANTTEENTKNEGPVPPENNGSKPATTPGQGQLPADGGTDPVTTDEGGNTSIPNPSEQVENDNHEQVTAGQ